MNEKLQNAIQALQEKFDGELQEAFNEDTVFIEPKNIVEAVSLLRDEFGFKLLASLTATDYWPEETPRFHLSYQLHNFDEQITIRLRVPVPGEKPSVPTIEGVFKNTNWFERELFDMFGIHIEGHSDLRRILMPHDWAGHPLRKDYPLGYEEPQFTFNFDEIAAKKPFATKDWLEKQSDE
jgi:NADH-quinone oxidoreductase subunit C